MYEQFCHKNALMLENYSSGQKLTDQLQIITQLIPIQEYANEEQW